MSYSLLLFDYDGTLCNSEAAILHSLRQVFTHYQVPVPPEAELERVVGLGLPSPDALQALRPQLAGAELAAWLLTYRSIYTNEGEELVKPFAGAREVLAAARAHNIAVAVVSNKGAVTLETSLTRLGLRADVQLLVGDGSYPDQQLPLKPSPVLYEQIVRPFFAPVLPAATLMIGDTAADLLFARNCGIDACWARYGFGDADACRALEPKHQIDGLRDVLRLMVREKAK
ncbi:HAD family hydrolase [Hymenobacter sp. BT507]|uniref:phosphoglycolate phosphatase n=1 Tax=Hymenobacter citatus TaxID=2763506 RepID=A0ABR7MMD1_9BACT|nr:HAD family hydrolase [Hymenobacter citatus]MBC6612242.1 HAD family hydrolase [Hymenobacter citatus]